MTDEIARRSLARAIELLLEMVVLVASPPYAPEAQTRFNHLKESLQTSHKELLE